METIILKTNEKVAKIDYNKEGYSVGGTDAELCDTRIQGTNANDTMYGTTGDDIMRGYGGNDVLFGGAGNDSMISSGGKNTLYGGAGSDYLYSGYGYVGIDTMNGGTGVDHFVQDIRYQGTWMKGKSTMVVQDFTHGVDSIDIQSADTSLSFSKFDTNNDGLLTIEDKGVMALHNADGTTGIQLAVSDHYDIQVQNQSKLTSSDFSFKAI